MSAMLVLFSSLSLAARTGSLIMSPGAQLFWVTAQDLTHPVAVLTARNPMLVTLLLSLGLLVTTFLLPTAVLSRFIVRNSSPRMVVRLVSPSTATPHTRGTPRTPEMLRLPNARSSLLSRGSLTLSTSETTRPQCAPSSVTAFPPLPPRKRLLFWDPMT